MFPAHNCFLFTPIVMTLYKKILHESRFCRIDFGVKRSWSRSQWNALITENGLRPIIAFPLHLSSWNSTHRLPTSRGCALLIFGSKSQRSRSQCNCYPFSPIITKLHTQTPIELRMCPVDLGSKGQGQNAWITENGLCCIIAKSVYTYHHETLHTNSQSVEDVPCSFWGQNVKGSVPVDFLRPKFRVAQTKHDVISILMNKYTYINMYIIKKIISCIFILCWDITALLKLKWKFAGYV